MMLAQYSLYIQVHKFFCADIISSQDSPTLRRRRQSEAHLSAKVRKSLIGHIQDFSSENVRSQIRVSVG